MSFKRPSSQEKLLQRWSNWRILLILFEGHSLWYLEGTCGAWDQASDQFYARKVPLAMYYFFIPKQSSVEW